MNLSVLFQERLLSDMGRLDLDNLEITDKDLWEAAPLANVRALHFGNNPFVTVEGLKSLASLKNDLQVLDLFNSGIRIDDAGLLIIVALFPRLKFLYFGGESVTLSLEGLKALAQCPELDILMVDREEYEDELRKLFPKLKIET